MFKKTPRTFGIFQKHYISSTPVWSSLTWGLGLSQFFFFTPADTQPDRDDAVSSLTHTVRLYASTDT